MSKLLTICALALVAISPAAANIVPRNKVEGYEIYSFNVSVPMALAGGRSGSASTTRYWDCAGAFCQQDLPKPYPHNRAPYWMNGEVYVHAAASDSILQGTAGCDTCYRLTRRDRSDTPSVIVHVDNWCPCQYNPSCCQDHFDIAAPGFDYATSSVYSQTCAQTDPAIPYVDGHQACMYGSPDSCDCNKATTDPQLQRGCEAFKALHCDNCQFDYQQVTCPF
jgi:hypothetical protein